MVRHLIAAAVLVSVASSSFAQDKLTLTGNRVQQGTVVKVEGGNVVLRMATGDVAFRLADVVSAEIPKPPALDAALKAVETRKFAEALPVLKAVVERYVNLPLDWLPHAYGVLGECYIAANQWPAAVDTYNKLLQYYPNTPHALRARVGLGRALVQEKKYDEALRLLESATEPLRRELLVSAADNYFLGAAMVAIGDCYAAKGEWDKALNSYLSTVVLYWRDEDAVRQAQKKADEIKEKLKSAT